MIDINTHRITALVRLTHAMCGLSAVDEALYNVQGTDTTGAMQGGVVRTDCAGGWIGAE